MPAQPNERRQSSSRWRDAFTPWKFFVCLLAVGLWLGAFQLLDLIIPGDTTHATTRQVNGGVEFTITSFKYAWLGIYFILGFFVIPPLVFWWFWPKLSEEFSRTRGITSTESGGSRIGNIFAFCLVGMLVAVGLAIIVMLVVREPLNKVHRVTIRANDVHLESLYRSWDILRRDIQRVNVVREIDRGRGGPGADYRVTIRLQNGEVFRSPSDVTARPPGGKDDQRYEAFFAELRAQLTKKP